ncbi:hypothetical protein [Sphingomonas sp.]|uniref:hypothetical protein n=1 Tax=Sphingomonas sp. TaxID=28214 RepID=UPI002DD62AB6|nr:hypothetical protein [Sphingomonas sp.]
MKTKTVSFFSYPKEIIELFQPVMALHKVHFAKVKKNNQVYFFKRVEAEQIIDFDREIWIVSASCFNIQSSILGKIQLFLPSVQEHKILMGSLSIKTDETYNELTNTFNSLKYAVKKSFKGGIWAKNTKTCKARYYKDIYMSPEAQMANQEISFLARYGEGNVSYFLLP